MLYDPPSIDEMREAAHSGRTYVNKYGFACDNCRVSSQWCAGWHDPNTATEFVEHIVAYKRINLCLPCRTALRVPLKRKCCWPWR